MSCCAVAPSRPQRQLPNVETPETIAKLFARRERLRRKLAELSVADDEAIRRLEALKPAMPEEMIVRDVDDRMTLDSSWFRPCAPVHGAIIWIPAEGWRDMLANPRHLRGSDKVDQRTLGRVRAGLAAAERYDELFRNAKLTAGYEASRKAYEAADDRLWKLDKRILAMTATSFGDIVLQAAVVQAHCADDEAPAEMVAALLASIGTLGGRHD